MQTSLAPLLSSAPSASSTPSAKELYFLLEHSALAEHRDTARGYLDRQLQAARALQDDVPADVTEMGEWMRARSVAVGQQYRDYLDARRSGAPRRYFASKSHAMYFIKAVAPTKLVDGSWLFALLDRWEDPDFRPLIQTYLEELGDGIAEKNHVVLYKKLLAGLECDQWRGLDDDKFVQGAIQLALAADAEHYLPEIVGYNLGYEQLPLHLLITSYELNELGIDPYYFTLHITVDNAGTGHAHKALQGVEQLMANAADPADFQRRMLDGYRLNDLGACTTSVIDEFDLEAELVQIMQDKSEPAENSRFWKLIQSERAEMFGVFSSYEQQILRDWIATPRAATAQAPATGARVISFRARQRAMETLGGGAVTRPNANKPRGVIRHHPAREADLDAGDGGSELRRLEQRLAAAGSKPAAMTMLIDLMSPARHHSAAGLMATRIFRQLLA